MLTQGPEATTNTEVNGAGVEEFSGRMEDLDMTASGRRLVGDEADSRRVKEGSAMGSWAAGRQPLVGLRLRGES